MPLGQLTIVTDLI